MSSMEDIKEDTIADMQTELTRRENLIRNLAHEIRTPVTVIKGYAEGLAYLYPDNNRVQKYMATIVEECNHLHKMSKNMLALCSIRGGVDSYERTKISTEALFKEFQARINNSIPYVDVRLHYDPTEITVNVFLVERAVYNLIANAIKHGDKDGQVIVSGEIRGDRYFFVVENDGPEISKEDIDYIWDAFYKADKARRRSESYGIGLAIVKETALLHGGSVSALSENRHTTLAFSVSIDSEAAI